MKTTWWRVQVHATCHLGGRILQLNPQMQKILSFVSSMILTGGWDCCMVLSNVDFKRKKNSGKVYCDKKSTFKRPHRTSSDSCLLVMQCWQDSLNWWLLADTNKSCAWVTGWNMENFNKDWKFRPMLWVAEVKSEKSGWRWELRMCCFMIRK